MRRAAAALAFLAALGMARKPPERKTMADKTEWSGGQCGMAGPGARVVEDAAAWEALWKEAFSAPAPKVDFAANVAVAVFVGVKPTGGWAPEFLPAETRGCLVVPYRVKGPSPGGFVIEAFTQPYAIKLYPRPKCAVKAEERR